MEKQETINNYIKEINSAIERAKKFDWVSEEIIENGEKVIDPKTKKTKIRKVKTFSGKYDPYFIDPNLIALNLGKSKLDFEIEITALENDKLTNAWNNLKDRNTLSLAYDPLTSPKVKEEILKHKMKVWSDKETTTTPIILKGFEDTKIMELVEQNDKLKRELNWKETKKQ